MNQVGAPWLRRSVTSGRARQIARSCTARSALMRLPYPARPYSSIFFLFYKFLATVSMLLLSFTRAADGVPVSEIRIVRDYPHPSAKPWPTRRSSRCGPQPARAAGRMDPPPPWARSSSSSRSRSPAGTAWSTAGCEVRGARGAISVFSAVRTTHAAGARVRADRAPGRPGAGERLVHQVLGRVPIAHADQDGEQALIPGVAVEVREVQSLGSHTLSTRSRRTPVTWLAPAPACRPAHPAEAGQLQRLDRHWLRRFSAGRVRVAGECPGGHGHRLSCCRRHGRARRTGREYQPHDLAAGRYVRFVMGGPGGCHRDW